MTNDTTATQTTRAWLFRVKGPAFRRAGSSEVVEGDISMAEETAENADAARRTVADRRRVPLANVEHVLDDSGVPVFRDYEPIRGAYGAARAAKYDHDEEIPPTGAGRGRAFF